MVDIRLLKTAHVPEEKSEQARRALKEFRALQPTLSAYARAYTGNPQVRVELSSDDNGSTDGTRIFYRPPIALGDPTPHERRLCDKRDEIGTPMCKACAIRESVLVTIYHEIAHIAQNTFIQPSDTEIAEAVQRAISEVGTKYSKEIERRARFVPPNYLSLASIISPYLPVLVNALEDTRVNAGLFKTHKGTRRMFDADTQRIFSEGVEQKDPATGAIVTIMWKDYKLNAQISCGVFCKASGYKYENWFDPVVVKALDDPKLTELLDQIQHATSATDSYELAFPVLARLRELGFCKADNDPEDEEPQEDGESGNSEEDSQRDGQEQGDSSGNDGAPVDADEDAGEERSDEDNSSGGDDGPEQDDSGADEDSATETPGDEPEAEGEPQEGAGGGDEHSEPSVSPDGDQGDGSPSSGSGTETSELPSGEDSGAGDSREGGDSDDRSDKSDDADESDEAEVEPIDTGADKGEGGTELIIPEDADMGTADDAMAGLMKVEQHEDLPKTMEARMDDTAMEVAVIQGLYFETPSNEVLGVRENKFGQRSDKALTNAPNSWENSAAASKNERRYFGVDGDFDPAEELLGPALLRMRVAFTDNQRGKTTPHLKTGRVNARVLGKRAPAADPRLFKKRTQPGKKNYYVQIMVDISGSTAGENLILTKRAVMAQANLLSRMGIKFGVVAHSGTHVGTSWTGPLELDVYLIKQPEEPWSEEVKKRLRELAPYEVNLDGHALEYGRKILDRVQATDKILLYYSDGKMPAENYAEELEILRREIRICAKKGYTLLGVGIRTDSPARHGLPTVQVDDDSDLVKVVRHIEQRLLARL